MMLLKPSALLLLLLSPAPGAAARGDRPPARAPPSLRGGGEALGVLAHQVEDPAVRRALVASAEWIGRAEGVIEGLGAANAELAGRAVRAEAAIEALMSTEGDAEPPPSPPSPSSSTSSFRTTTTSEAATSSRTSSATATSESPAGDDDTDEDHDKQEVGAWRWRRRRRRRRRVQHNPGAHSGSLVHIYRRTVRLQHGSGLDMSIRYDGHSNGGRRRVQQKVCRDDSAGFMARLGFSCTQGMAEVHGDCNFDMSKNDESNLVPAGTRLRDVCPKTCNACTAAPAPPHGPKTCTAPAISVHINEMNVACCGASGGACHGGVPAQCNTRCASVLLPFWAQCGAALSSMSLTLHSTVGKVAAQCQAGNKPAPSGGASFVRAIQLVCAGRTGATSRQCVPKCDSRLHGDLLLLNLDGNDHKYSCEVQHGQHSWVGPATDGGYLGSDVQTFVSAVVSGAAGYFMLTLAASAGISTLLTVEPGQTAVISGSSGGGSVAWGSGGFSVLQHGTLRLFDLTLNGPLTVAAGATLQLSNVTMGRFACVTMQHGGNIVMDAAQPPPRKCVKCAAIPHCRKLECTAKGVSSCAECDAGYFAFRRSSTAVDARGSCVANTATASSAGLTPTSTGTFSFTFSGALPSDLTGGNLTLTAGRQERTVVSLSGTGSERLGVALTVDGAQLSLAHLTLAVPSASIRNGGSLSLRSVSGSLTQFSVSNSAFNHDASNFILAGAVSFANAGTVSLTDANFGPATSLSVSRGTACSITAAGITTSPHAPSLTGMTVTDATFSLAAASALPLGGIVSFHNAGTVSLTGTQFSPAGTLSVSGGTACHLTNLALPETRDLFNFGSSLTLSAATLSNHRELGALSGNITVGAGGLFVAQPPSLASAVLPGNPQCFRPYTTLTDSWRSIMYDNGNGNGHVSVTDVGPGTAFEAQNGLVKCNVRWDNCYTGVGGDHWYRFEGAAGDAMPLAPPQSWHHSRALHCGSSHPGWLSGWSGGSLTDTGYSTPGRYPTAAEGVMEMTVCFSYNRAIYPCHRHSQVGVLRCEGFLLWRLSNAPIAGATYCGAPSGLFAPKNEDGGKRGGLAAGSFDSQCTRPYTTLRDTWRSITTQTPSTTDIRRVDASRPWSHGFDTRKNQYTGVGGGRWYRFAGAGGDALALRPPLLPGRYCGSKVGNRGWLSGWGACTGHCLPVPSNPTSGVGPPSAYKTAGTYPTAAKGVVDVTICFGSNAPGYTCRNHAAAKVVRCNGFLLWQLSDAPDTGNGAAYCTANDNNEKNEDGGE